MRNLLFQFTNEPVSNTWSTCDSTRISSVIEVSINVGDRIVNLFNRKKTRPFCGNFRGAVPFASHLELLC